MDHARHFHVGREVLLSKNLGRDVLALDRLADDLVFARVLGLRLAGRIKRVAVFLVPVELDVEIAAADQVGVADFFRSVGLRMHHAVGHSQLVRRKPKFFCRHVDQHTARFG